MNRRSGCRTRPGPILAVEELIGEHPGVYSPEDVGSFFAGALDPATVAEIVAYLLDAGRLVLDAEHRLVRRV